MAAGGKDAEYFNYAPFLFAKITISTSTNFRLAAEVFNLQSPDLATFLLLTCTAIPTKHIYVIFVLD